MPTLSPKEINLFWFRRDLRLPDNAGLHKALSSATNILPIFVFDPILLDKLPHPFDKRVCFIHERLSALKNELQKQGSDLLVLHDTPLNAFRKLLSQYNVSAVFCNGDYEPYALDRDKKVEKLLAGSGVLFQQTKDAVIYEKNEVVKADGKPYTVFTPYSRTWKKRLQLDGLPVFASEKLGTNLFDFDAGPMPSLQQLGFKGCSLAQLPTDLDPGILTNYHSQRDFPALQATSKMSVHLRFGTVSIRQLVALAQLHSEKWLDELIWREFYQMILWHFPQVVHSEFKRQYRYIEWDNNEGHFAAWCEGRTGYPIVDAGMRELNETGLMHNRVRMIVASFLTKHLLIDWRWGEKYFADKLLDFELASNNGGWQWAASTGCDAVPYFRIFNPYLQTKKFDPELAYVRKWVPEFDLLSYPEPIVEHAVARQRALAAYKKALTKG